jgi:hypothetical protein
MSREVLLALLGALLLINVGVLISIAVLSALRGTTASLPVEERRPRAVRPTQARSPEAYQPTTIALPSVTDPPIRRGADAPETAASHATAAVATIERDAPLVPGTMDFRPTTPPTNGSNGERSADPDVTGQREPSGLKRGKRQRRFVLPPLDDDNVRSVRAIEAFLEHPPDAGHTHDRPHRRRHRARRPAGTRPPRTAVVLELEHFGLLEQRLGRDSAERLTGAVAEALWRGARTTDEIRELGSGRFEIVLDADESGVDAFVSRATNAMQPWLTAYPVALGVAASRSRASGRS